MFKKDNNMTPSAQASADRIQTALHVVEGLDQRLTEASDEALTEAQIAAALAWVHRDLMVPVIVTFLLGLDAEGVTRESPTALVESAIAGIEMIRLLLEGKVRLGQDLAFETVGLPTADWDFRVAAVDLESDSAVERGKLVEWFHQRITHTAQRTRFHSEGELDLLSGSAEAEVILCALRLFGMSQLFELEECSAEAATVSVATLALVAKGNASIEWTSKGLLFKALHPPA